MKKDQKIVRGNLKEKNAPKILRTEEQQRPKNFISFKEYLIRKNEGE
jgi:hypothetical protein